MRARTLGFVAAVTAGAMLSSSVPAAERPPLPKIDWSFAGVFGTFDPAARQRGFQVYQEVCAGCHGMKHLYYRDLAHLGYSEEQVKAFAAGVEVDDGPNDDGDMFKRPGRPTDKFKTPFANEPAARAANNGALPPDLSLIIKARADGANYVYGVMTGYADPPSDVTLMQGMHYNRYFPGNQIAMPQPLQAERVTYADGTRATLEQEAQDLVTFLAWAAEPELEARKAMGVKVLLFLLVFTGILYAVKRRVWAKLH
jgi:ubiquinol-cytochrome c reductase cytochrome c1 subunit